MKTSKRKATKSNKKKETINNNNRSKQTAPKTVPHVDDVQKKEEEKSDDLPLLNQQKQAHAQAQAQAPQKQNQNQNQNQNQKQTQKQTQTQKPQEQLQQQQQRNQQKDFEINEGSSSSLDDVEEDVEDEEFPTELKEYQQRENEKNEKRLPPEVELLYLQDLFYDSEDSENERSLNTTGNVPLEWYDDYDHVGYDLEGKKIIKPKREDAIDRLLAQDQEPWSVFNEKTGKRELISKGDMEIIKSIKSGAALERYAPENWHIELNDYTDMVHPAANIPAPKSRFIPSKWEAKRVRKLAYAVRKGWLKLDEAKQEVTPKFYELWDEGGAKSRLGARHIPAPKPPLPGNIESYNPPEEYIMDEEEKKAWELLDPEDRPFNFLPQKNSSLRTTPAYEKFHRERFERCLDLYLATRSKKKRMWVDPETLIPKLPKPSELQPFPTLETIQYLGHTGYVRSISIDPSGQWLASGSDDGTLRIWEVSTGRQFRKYTITDGNILSLEWNPNPDLFIIMVVTNTLFMYHPSELANVPQRANTEQFFRDVPQNNHNEKVKGLIEWEKPDEKDWKDDMRLKIHFKETQVKFATWHYKGDYFSTVCPDANRSAVLIHQLSRQQSQNPFTKSKGIIQCVRFHPSKPYFYVATQKHVRIYNLAQQKLMKKLLSGTKWISSMHIHPGGDNLIIGSYDKRVCWFDLDLGSKPYKMLSYHKFAVRSVCYHSRYPLFASCSDDGCIHVFHGMVYDDLLQNPFIVPLKVLRGHDVVNELGVLDIKFHPSQPWIFSSGADGTIRLYT